MGGIFNAITELILAVAISIIAYIAAIVVFAYSGYFVGMVVALAAGFILGVGKAIIPVRFACAFIGIATILFIAIYSCIWTKGRDYLTEYVTEFNRRRGVLVSFL